MLSRISPMGSIGSKQLLCCNLASYYSFSQYTSVNTPSQLENGPERRAVWVTVHL